jgi:type I restriction enzyme S subunit
MTGAGGLKRVPDEFTRNFPVVLPKLVEQRVIAAHLDRETARIDALIEKKNRFIELLREKRQALIISAVTKGLDPNVRMKDSGVGWLGEVPEHWNILQLRHTARLESGHTPSRSKPEYWVECNVPWFTLADVWQVRSGEQMYVKETTEKVSQLGLENSSARLLPAGSVFLSRTASVGFPGIMAVDMATSQDFAVWTCTSELFNEYLYYVLLGMKPDFDRLMMGSTHKTIYMPDIEAIRLARPPLDEQRGIVSALSGQLGRFKIVIDKTERSIELLKERRSALITAAVTGQIDLRETV